MNCLRAKNLNVRLIFDGTAHRLCAALFLLTIAVVHTAGCTHASSVLVTNSTDSRLTGLVQIPSRLVFGVAPPPSTRQSLSLDPGASKTFRYRDGQHVENFADVYLAILREDGQWQMVEFDVLKAARVVIKVESGGDGALNITSDTHRIESQNVFQNHRQLIEHMGQTK